MTQLDTQYIRQLIETHGGAISLYARQWCNAPDDALQEALIELIRQEPAPDSPIAWLYKTVRRRAMNQARADQRRARHHRQASEQQQSWFQPPEEMLDEPVDLEPLLARLPRLEREIVVAHIWGELSLQQIADLVELSISSVHRKYHQALAELGQMLDSRPDNARTDSVKSDSALPDSAIPDSARQTDEPNTFTI